ncbi:MAG: PilW family protein [Proteobacteria bacterium]|nr:PilW family protein [Pseudomonadota bacterium]
MIAILIGMLLVLGAFKVLADFEGNKRSTTAVNDAMQSGNYGLFALDKLIRSAGSGLSRYAAKAGWGCTLNFKPTDGATTAASSISSSGPPSLNPPFNGVLPGALRLAPVMIVPGDAPWSSTATKSDVFMVMLGGSGYSEAPVRFKPNVSGGLSQVDSNVGFSAGEWVLVGSGGIGECMISHVASTFNPAGNNVSLPLADTTVGNAAGLITAGNYVVALGNGVTASFLMLGVDTATSSLMSLDLLNSPTSTPQALADDVVMMRVIYQVQPRPVDPLTWTNPVGNVTIGGIAYNYTPTGLNAGTAAASAALRSIVAVRIALVVRAPLNEQKSTNVNSGSVKMFDALDSPTCTSATTPACANPVTVTWTYPAGNYRYRKLETTIPVRNASF